MSSFKKLTICVIATVIIFSVAISSFAIDDAMEITDFKTKIVMQENNVAKVTESIDVFYKQDRRGIYRNIPTDNRVVHEIDGNKTEKNYKALVSDIAVTMDGKEVEASADRNDGMMSVRIGSEDVYISGSHTYDISYTYDFGDDGITDFDFFYMSLTGSNWESPLNHISFDITLPKPFESEGNLGFSFGRAGSSSYDPKELKYTVNGNSIRGETLRVMQPGESIDVRLTLPKGYFVDARSDKPNGLLLIAIAGGFALASLLIFLLIKKPKKRVATVEFTPPEDLNSADVGFILDCYADTKDIISLIIYWANKGYISISQASKKHMELAKLKPLEEDANNYETLFFNRLFEDGDVISTKDFTPEIGSGVVAACSRLKTKFTTGDTNIINHKSMGLSVLNIILMPLPLAFAFGVATYFNTLEVFMFWISLFVVFVVGVVLGSIYNSYNVSNKSSTRGKIVARSIFMYLFAFLYFAVLTLLISSAIGWLFAIIITICSVIIFILIPFILTRNNKGEEYYARIKGFKHFIETVEEDRLRVLSEENPQYFYDILPYALVFGITDNWAKKFEKIHLPQPSWYYGSDYPFSSALFSYVLVSSMLNNTHRAIASNSNGGGINGGGFSGGSFSGGGFGGGGGGGSW